jgi:hypothetical protein
MHIDVVQGKLKALPKKLLAFPKESLEPSPWNPWPSLGKVQNLPRAYYSLPKKRSKPSPRKVELYGFPFSSFPTHNTFLMTCVTMFLKTN